MYDEDLFNLDDWIRRLKVEYDIYFIGNRRKPPDDLRMRVEKLIKRLSEATNMSASQRFLYNTLIARFYVCRDRWRRTQQERESARELHDAPVSSTRTPFRDAQTRTLSSEVQVSIGDPDAEAGKVRRLYEELLRLRGNHAKKSPSVSYRQFAKYIAAQTQGIQKRCQCTSVTFRIALEEKTIKFTAKANTSSSS